MGDDTVDHILMLVVWYEFVVFLVPAKRAKGLLYFPCNLVAGVKTELELGTSAQGDATCFAHPRPRATA